VLLSCEKETADQQSLPGQNLQVVPVNSFKDLPIVILQMIYITTLKVKNLSSNDITKYNKPS
jgi:hypothetical protein